MGGLFILAYICYCQGDHPVTESNSTEPPEMAIPHNLAKTVSTLLVALRRLWGNFVARDGVIRCVYDGAWYWPGDEYECCSLSE